MRAKGIFFCSQIQNYIKKESNIKVNKKKLVLLFIDTRLTKRRCFPWKRLKFVAHLILPQKQHYIFASVTRTYKSTKASILSFTFWWWMWRSNCLNWSRSRSATILEKHQTQRYSHGQGQAFDNVTSCLFFSIPHGKEGVSVQTLTKNNEK